MRGCHGGTLAVAAILLTFSGVRALGGEDLSTERVQQEFRRELIQRGLANVIPVLEDHGITSLSILAKLEEEDFRSMPLKLGHRREMLHWWKSLPAPAKNGIWGKVHARRVHDLYPSPAATHADWGMAQYAHCVQPYSWDELVHGYKNRSVTFKTGGLGKLLDKGGYQTWQCFPDHYCAADASDPWFCFVYHETEKVFTPWGENSKLQLVKSSGTQAGCPHFNHTETGSICDIGLTRNARGVCVLCETGKYKPAAGDERCYPCESGQTTGPGLVPRSACLPAWLHVHEGNYYLNLNETVNWSEYYPSRTSWEKARFVKRPEPGDTSVLLYNDDYTFASWNGEYSVGHNFSAMPWGIAMDCRCCGLESSFSFDLISTPFQIEGSPSLNWCDDDCLSSAGPSGHNPHGSVTCGSTACTGSVGGMCGYGGLVTSSIGSKSHFSHAISRYSNVVTLLTSDGPLLGFHPGVLQNADHLERAQGKDYPMCEKDIATAGSCFNEEGTVAVCVCAAGYFSDAPGGTCKKCRVGSFCSTGGAVAGSTIAPCPANSTSPAGSTNITNCTCNVGYTGPDGGSCAACEAGKYKEAVGSAACTQCPPGTLASPGSTESAACVAPAPFFNASSTVDCSSDSEDCSEYNLCQVHRLVQTRSTSTPEQSDSFLRSSASSDTHKEEVLSSQFVRTDEMHEGKYVWHSSAADGTRICWGGWQNVWNIFIQGKPCTTFWAERIGYIHKNLVGADFVLYTTRNQKLGILMCWSY